MNKKNIRYIVLFFVCMFSINESYGQEKFFYEIGPLGGMSYYIGEGNRTIFQNTQPTSGGVFRYKFNPRWVIAAKAQTSAIAFEKRKNSFVEADVTAEFNFFHLERNTWHRFAKTYSPYLFMGLGLGLYKNNTEINSPFYLPIGLGFKWNFTPRMNLNIEWQHQLYFADNTEGVIEWDNANNINGSNFMNNDLFSTLTIGITVNFGKESKICRCGQ